MTSTNLNAWAATLVCPLDRAPLTHAADGTWRCTQCEFNTPLVDVSGRQILDFRCIDQTRTVAVEFRLPVTPLDRYEIARAMFRGPALAKQASTSSSVPVTTKLDQAAQHYLQKIVQQHGTQLRVLDLGCGNGDNQRFMREALGVQDVFAVDWWATGADILVDAHRLPFAAGTFDIVVSTAVFEHLYNPFLAMAEISRVSRAQAWFLGGASFWEAWHGSSYFHLTPDGWNVLLTQNGYRLDDLWVGWGIVPAALSHVLVPGYFRRFGYWLQGVIERLYRLREGEIGVRKMQLRASGSYIVYASRDHS